MGVLLNSQLDTIVQQSAHAEPLAQGNPTPSPAGTVGIFSDSHLNLFNTAQLPPYACGSTLTLDWSFASPSSNDWIGLYQADATDYRYPWNWAQLPDGVA